MSIAKQENEQAAQIQRLEARISTLEAQQVSCSNSLNLLVFSGERDKLLAAFVMATGASATGMDVSMFFTFWGTAGLKKSKSQVGEKSLVERAFGLMLPGGVNQTKLSNMDMLGVGRHLMSAEMKKKGVAELPELIEVAAELGVKFQVCEMSMNLMGITREELIDYPFMEYCGVTTFMDQATEANTTLFV